MVVPPLPAVPPEPVVPPGPAVPPRPPPAPPDEEPPTPTEPAEPVFTLGDLNVDLGRRQVFVSAKEIHLTPIEYKLLTTLIRYAGRVMTHRQLLKEVWGPLHVEEGHYLRVYMRQLRNKLEKNPAHPRYLVTELGVGYRLRTE